MTAGLANSGSFFMADTYFRGEPSQTINIPVETSPDPEPNRRGAEQSLPDMEPVEPGKADSVVLSALGIDDSPKNLPDEEQENLSELRGYINEMMKSKGVAPTVGAYKRFLEETKQSMGIDRDADADVVLNKIGSVVRSYKSLSFISNPKERRAVFMQLARQPDSISMDNLIYKEMEKRRVWA